MMSSMMDQKDFPEPTSVTDLELGLGPDETKKERLDIANKPKKEVIVAVFGVFAVVLIGAIVWSGSATDNVQCGVIPMDVHRGDPVGDFLGSISRCWRERNKRSGQSTPPGEKDPSPAPGKELKTENKPSDPAELGRYYIPRKEQAERDAKERARMAEGEPQQKQDEAASGGNPGDTTRRITMNADLWEKLYVAKEIARYCPWQLVTGRRRVVDPKEGLRTIINKDPKEPQEKFPVSIAQANPILEESLKMEAIPSVNAVIDIKTFEYSHHKYFLGQRLPHWESESPNERCLRVVNLVGLTVDKGYFMFFRENDLKDSLQSAVDTTRSIAAKLRKEVASRCAAALTAAEEAERLANTAKAKSICKDVGATTEAKPEVDTLVAAQYKAAEARDELAKARTKAAEAKVAEDRVRAAEAEAKAVRATKEAEAKAAKAEAEAAEARAEFAEAEAGTTEEGEATAEEEPQLRKVQKALSVADRAVKAAAAEREAEEKKRIEAEEKTDEDAQSKKGGTREEEKSLSGTTASDGASSQFGAAMRARFAAAIASSSAAIASWSREHRTNSA